ncbi:hypothetical protein [Clostridium sp. C2-6-12]|uniref:hypothetical protein n=1 Tax=Clostridium sp. C2-6-12 TaxID=2698832 RepID=UPI001369CD6D|nr:hypothetical protein [Clostridium sp. C2-6-12]
MIKQIFSYLPILIGISLILLGFTGWNKQKILLLVKINIREEELKACSESIGKTYIMFGISFLILMTIGLADNDVYNFTAFIISILVMIIGTIKNIKTHKKYKMGRWSK